MKKKPVSFKEFFAKVNATDGSQQYADYSVTAEGEYAQGQDNVAQPGGYDNIGFKNNGPTFTVEKSQRDKVINTCINFLEKLNKNGIPINGEEMDKMLSQLQKMADSLSLVGIEPVDIIATIKAPHMAGQYLIKGPSAPGGGGKGALQDLKDIKAGLLVDDESNPGGADVTADIENIDNNNFTIKPYLNDPNNGKDQPEGALEEHKKLSKLEQVIEEMNRREFIGKIAKGATAVAGGNIIPQGVAGNVLKGALGTKKLFNIDEILLNFIIPAEGRSIAAIATTRPAFLNELQFDKNIFGGLLDAINGKALNISISEKRSLEQYFSIIGMFENVITGKATKDEINTLDGFYDFEGRFGKKRPSLKDFVGLYEETIEDFYENNEDIIHYWTSHIIVV